MENGCNWCAADFVHGISHCQVFRVDFSRTPDREGTRRAGHGTQKGSQKDVFAVERTFSFNCDCVELVFETSVVRLTPSASSRSVEWK